MPMDDQSPPRPHDLPPGYDEEDPYEDVDLDKYPDWWRENIEEFASYGMRPYRPPRFSDGEVTPSVITSLEDQLDVTIWIRSIDPHQGGDWQVWVDEEPVTSIDRTREPEGFSKYHVDSEEFETIIRECVGD